MEKIMQALQAIREINEAYSLSNDGVEKTLQEAGTARVCTPVIGKFSSGKSALMNTVLGYNRKLLTEDITPETAVPTEIIYGEEEYATVYYNNDSAENIDIGDYRELEVDANTVKCIRLTLRNDRFLSKIPDVMLVDMPGFESGFEIHNKAIDNYLPQSLAYIIAVPADDMIIRSSVGNILKELCLHDMPLCVVITKYDKRNVDEFEAAFENMKKNLKRFIGEREVMYCRTSSFDGNAEELEEFLLEIQKQSQNILADKFKHAVFSVMDNTENYLKTTLANSEMSESELDEEEERLNRQMSELDSNFTNEKSSFDSQIVGCVEEIKSDVQAALDAEESTLITMAMNNQELNSHLNSVVRSTVTTSIKKRFVPKVEKYLKRLDKCINGDAVSNVHVSLNVDTKGMKLNLTASVVAVVAGIALALPVIGVILGGVLAIVSKFRSNKKREEIRNDISRKLHSEVFPQILSEVGRALEIEISKQLMQINTSVENEIQTQRQTLEKAVADLRGRMQNEKADKDNLIRDIQIDLERMEEIRNGL